MKNGIVYASLVVLLIVLCLGVGVLGYFTQGFRSWDFDIKETVNKDSKGSIAAVAPEIYDSDTIGLAYAASTSSTATITATVLPETAANRNVTWSIAWANADSSFASGKDVSDYITLSSNGNVATVECLQPFGEKINVVASSASTPEISATCVLNYVRRIESASYYVYVYNSNESDPGSATANSADVGSGGNYYFDAYTYSTSAIDFPDMKRPTHKVRKFGLYDIHYGIGTVDDEYSVEFVYELNSAFFEEVFGYFSSLPNSGPDELGMYDRIEEIIMTSASDTAIVNIQLMVNYNEFIPFLVSTAAKYDYHWTVTAKFTGQYSTFTDTIYVGYNPSSLVIPAASVSMSSNEVFF